MWSAVRVSRAGFNRLIAGAAQPQDLLAAGDLTSGLARQVVDVPTSRLICEVRNLMPDPGDGTQRWPAVHALDAAALRTALLPRLGRFERLPVSAFYEDLDHWYDMVKQLAR